jgi:hypothetical protein
MPEEISENRTENDDDSTHCGCTALRVMTLRAVIADELSPADSFKEFDEDGCDKQGEKEGESSPEE